MESNKLERFEGTKKEKFFYHNTLLCLAKSLQDTNITVDLRNDSYLCGKLSNVDGFMNLSFTKVIYCDTHGNEYYFENLFVQARNIRYIHIPETVSIINNINKELDRVRPKKPDVKKPVIKSRKAKKALKQHMQIVASL